MTQPRMERLWTADSTGVPEMPAFWSCHIRVDGGNGAPRDLILMADRCGDGRPSLTNAFDRCLGIVLGNAACQAREEGRSGLDPGIRIVYRDSMGRWDQAVPDGRTCRFAPLAVAGDPEAEDAQRIAGSLFGAMEDPFRNPGADDPCHGWAARLCAIADRALAHRQDLHEEGITP